MTECPRCQAELPGNAKFCLECGSSISVMSAVSGQSGIEGDKSLGDLQTMAGATGDRSLGELQTMARLEGGPVIDGAHGVAILERYELMEEIGRGGFARVWKARDRKLSRIVAVKRLQAALLRGAMGEQTLARFRREAMAIASLNHRNIVAVYDHDRDDEGDYIVMECVEGGSLRDYLKERGGKLDAPDAMALVRGIAQGLSYAHRKNLVHRDIKPGNVLLQRDGDEVTPKIVDFGLARAGSESELSMTGYGIGTPWYMPPEQRRDAKGVNHTADIYALGKLLYEMISGETPDNVDPEKIPALPGLSDVIFKCIKTNPEERYFSAEEVYSALEKINGINRRTAAYGSIPFANTCPSCGAHNPDVVAFCEMCGLGLTRQCPVCERENSVNKKFCGVCGTDVDGYLGLQEIVTRMDQYLAAKKYSRVLKEAEQAERLQFSPRDGKGRALLEQAKKLQAEAQELQWKEMKKEELWTAVQEAKNLRNWHDVLVISVSILALDADHREAQHLKEEAKAHLGHYVRIVTMLDEQEVPADITFGDQTWKAPCRFRLQEGGQYSAHFSYQDQGRTLGAPTLRLCVDWIGDKEIRVSLCDSPVDGRAWISPQTGMQFQWIDTLQMWVGMHEVTHSEYRRKEPGHNMAEYGGHSFNGTRQPVVGVNFDDARGYCAWLNRLEYGLLPANLVYRLPNESEWLTFAQCGDDRKYPWGNHWPPTSGQAGNYQGQEGDSGKRKISGYHDGFPVTASVDQVWKNHWGLHGVGGNVWEACTADCNGNQFGAWRGASWSNATENHLRCNYRSAVRPHVRASNFGFRLVLAQKDTPSHVASRLAAKKTSNNAVIWVLVACAVLFVMFVIFASNSSL